MGGSAQNPGNFNSNVADIPAVDATGAGTAIVAEGGSISIQADGVGTGIGIQATSNSGTAIVAQSTNGTGIQAASNSGSASGTAIVAKSQSGYGITSEGGNIGVYAHNLTTPGIAVYLATSGLAGDFRGNIDVWGNGNFRGDVAASGNGNFGNVAVSGNVTVSGDVILTGADCAEEFDVAETVDIEPGTVMVLDQDGSLHQSQKAYDKRVAGVVSGAGDYRPGLILDRRQSQDYRVPVALVGKVYCKVDAQYAAIEVGDLLTTSPTPGHAMKAADPFKAFGSVIGKALRPLKAGRETIPILIALQ